MIRRLHSPAMLEAVVSSPEIAPLDHGFTPAAWLAEPENIALWERDNIALFTRRGPGVFEGHTLFADKGRAALDLGKAMLREMFDTYGAKVIWGQTPIERKAARWFSRKLGFRSHGSVDRPLGTCELFILENRP